MCMRQEEARRQLSLRQRLNFGGMPHMHPITTHSFSEMDSTLNTTQMNHLDPPNSVHTGSPSKGMVPVNSSPLPFAPQDPNQIAMQMPHLPMPSLLSPHQHPAIVPMSYESGPTGGRISPTPVHAAEGLMESMEPPLKFEEDEDAFNCASADDLMGFFPTVAGEFLPLNWSSIAGCKLNTCMRSRTLTHNYCLLLQT